MSSPGPVAEIVGRIAYAFTQIQPMIGTEVHIIFAALFPIVTASHASLSRPSSAAKPLREVEKKKVEADGDGEDDDDEDEEEEEEDTFQRMEGFSRIDALWMPLFAGAVLTGLYFLIKYLQDLQLLNKILNWYFSTIGLFSVCKLIADVLRFFHSFIFPKWYSDAEGVWQAKAAQRKMLQLSVPKGKEPEVRLSPLPGVLAKLPLPARVHRLLWVVRAIPSNKWSFKLYIRCIAAFRTQIGVFGVIGSVLGLLATVYYNLVDKPWWLTNLMGFAFSYTSLQLISPTTFDTGSLILAGLFVYDIIMVFYTPMMVTVAKSLDVPIKLVIPRPPNPDKPGIAQYSMLGLGDIVLPGMMIGLALRFDLYRHYLKKQEHCSQAGSKGTTADTATKKVKYIPPGNYWSSQFWTSSWLGRQDSLSASTQTGSFSKTYFWTSIVGYVIGMITTLAVMMVFQHAQPALLYLVPGVLISLWGMALINGDLKEMWNYTEAEEEAEQKLDQGVMQKSGVDQTVSSKNVQQANSEPEEGTSVQGKRKEKGNRDLVYFAITQHTPMRRSRNSSKANPNWVDSGEGNDDRPGKRQRTT